MRHVIRSQGRWSAIDLSHLGISTARSIHVSTCVIHTLQQRLHKKLSMKSIQNYAQPTVHSLLIFDYSINYYLCMYHPVYKIKDTSLSSNALLVVYNFSLTILFLDYGYHRSLAFGKMSTIIHRGSGFVIRSNVEKERLDYILHSV